MYASVYIVKVCIKLYNTRKPTALHLGLLKYANWHLCPYNIRGGELYYGEYFKYYYLRHILRIVHTYIEI